MDDRTARIEALESEVRQCREALADAERRADAAEDARVAALQVTEERLRLATECTGFGTFDYFPQTGELIWSEHAREHFGLSPDAHVDYDVFLRGLHPDDRERVDRIVQGVLRGEGGGEYATEYRTIGIEDGKERWLAARGRVFFDDEGRPVRFIGGTLDITERKRAEERQDALYGITAALSRAATTTDVAAVVTDQVRRVVGVVSAALFRLDEGDNALHLVGSAGYPPDAEERFRRVPLSARTISSEAARTGRPVTVVSTAEANARYPDSRRFWSPQGGRAAFPLVTEGRTVGVITFLMGPRYQPREGDVEFLVAVAGQVALALERTRLYEAEQQARAEAEEANREKDQFVALVSHELRNPVEDTGVGIDGETLRRLFRVFQQGQVAGRTQQGLGLGLALVKGIVEAHGGRVRAESEGTGKGSRFTVELPLIEGPTLPVQGPRSKVQAPEPATQTGMQPTPETRDLQPETRNPIRLLLVEDNEDTLALLAAELEGHGYEVHPAASGEEALEILRRVRPDVILSDIRMPGMDGYQFLRRAREIPDMAQVPAFAVTACNQPEDVRQATEAGFIGHFAKPVNVSVLDHRIREVVSAGG